VTSKTLFAKNHGISVCWQEAHRLHIFSFNNQMHTTG
jgi:hypothetical protein